MEAQNITHPLAATLAVMALNAAPEGLGLGAGLTYFAMTKNDTKAVELLEALSISDTKTITIAQYALPAFALEQFAETFLKNKPLMKNRRVNELSKIALLGGVNLTGALMLKKPLKDAALLTAAEYAALKLKDYFLCSTD